MKNSTRIAMAILAVLMGLFVFAMIGCDVSCTPVVAAEVVWDAPVPGGCYTKPADGFLVRIYIDGVAAKTDTVWTARWESPLTPGTTEVKVAAFWMDGETPVVSQVMTPECTLLPDTLWSAMSDPITVLAQAGQASQPIVGVRAESN